MKILYVGNLSDIFCLRWALWFKEHGVNVCAVNCHPITRHSILSLYETIRTFKPDILHAHYAGQPGIAATIMHFHPLVITIHGSDVLLTKGWKRIAVRFTLVLADLITTDAHHIYRKVTEEWKINRDKVKMINFGVDLNRFQPYETLRTEKPHILFRTGPDDVIYDPETARKAMTIVESRISGVTWEFIKDVPEEDMPRFLNKAWVYVSTATSDAGISSTTAEAMACGIPAIVTSAADNEFWVQPYYRFAPGDHKTLAARIIELIGNESERKKESVGNRSIVERSNDINREMSKMQKLYTEVIEHGKQKR